MSLRFRILIYAITLFAIIFLPWWASAVIILASILFIDRYFEALIFAFIADVVFRNPNAHFSWWFVVIVAALLVLFEGVIKRKFRFYSNAV